MKFFCILRLILLPLTALIIFVALIVNLYAISSDVAFIRTSYQVIAHIPFATSIVPIIWLCIAGGFLLIEILLFIICGFFKKNKKVKKETNSGGKVLGFDYEKDGEKLVVHAKYGSHENGYGPGINEMFDVLPEMFQSVFNLGYTKIVSIKIKERRFLFERIDCDIEGGPRFSKTPVIRLTKYYEDKGRPFFKKEPIIKKQKVKKEVPLNPDDDPNNYQGPTVVREVIEDFIVGYKDVKYQNREIIYDYRFKGSENPVIAVDGSKLIYRQIREDRIR